MSGVGLAVALSAWLPVENDVIHVASRKASVQTSPPSPGSPGSFDLWTPAPPATAQRTPLMMAQTATAGLAVPIAVAGPQRLQVGDMNDLVIGLGSNAGVGEISFTVQFDPNVLQVRAGTEGDWATDAGLDARFAAEISGAEERVKIRSTVSGKQVGGAGGSVAIVRFQAVAPGTTSVLFTEVAVKDLAGRALVPVVSPPYLPVTVDSVPPAQPETWRQPRGVAAEPPTEKTEDGD